VANNQSRQTQSRESPKEISEMVGDDLRVVAANRQVCPTISEITFGNLYKSLTVAAHVSRR